MKTNNQLLKLLMLVLAFGLMVACSDEEDGGSIFHCSYEVSRTGCNDSVYSPYEQGCLTVDSATLRDDVNVSTYCSDLYPSSDIYCASSCCISYKYRNVTQEGGACPGETASLALLAGNTELRFDADWAGGDVDLELLTPMHKLVSSQNPEAGGCAFSGDDRYMQNGTVEFVQCRGVYLDGGYDMILSNHSAELVAVNIKVTKNGDVIHRQHLTLAPGEAQTHSVSVQ